jgi:hypothetical protein
LNSAAILNFYALQLFFFVQLKYHLLLLRQTS